MRACFVSDQSFPSMGGEGISTENFSLALRKRGHKVIVLTSRPKNPPVVKEIKIYRFFSIPIPGGRNKGYFGFPSLKEILFILKKEKIEIIQINTSTYLGWQTLRGAKKLGIPVVLGFHTQIENVIPPHFSLLIFYVPRKITEGWFSYFYQKGNLVITPSYFAAQILQRYTHNSHNSFKVISNGVNLEKFNHQKINQKKEEKFKEKYSLEDSKFIILYVGRLDYEKNIPYLFKIMKSLKEKEEKSFGIKLVVVGRGFLENELKKKRKKLGMEREIIFTGYLKENDLLCAYACADTFILPSLAELQSISTLEAMAMKNVIMVAKSKENAGQELVKEEINGYTFSLKNPEDAAEKILKIFYDKKLKKEMQEESLKMVQKHNMKVSILKLEEIYLKLINGYGRKDV